MRASRYESRARRRRAGPYASVVTDWTPVVAVVVGGAIATTTQIATQLLGNRRESRRELRAASAKAAAEWRTLQLQTLADMQENLEQGASNISEVLADSPGMLGWRRGQKFPEMVPFARALMLCSRLEDRQLAADVRAWIVANRNLMSQEQWKAQDWIAIRDRRIALQDRIGDAIRAMHER